MSLPLKLEVPKHFHLKINTRGITHHYFIKKLENAQYFSHIISSAVCGLCIPQLCKSGALRHPAIG